MRAKVIIENGITEIHLLPENEFERDIIEKSSNKPNEYKLQTDITAKNSYGVYSQHKIVINVTTVIN
jgi:sulfur transfer complex TusBCD TusB component (DsrH family)